jgi:hypothetical protein
MIWVLVEEQSKKTEEMNDSSFRIWQPKMLALAFLCCSVRE